jgi:hypothetical protein
MHRKTLNKIIMKTLSLFIVLAITSCSSHKALKTLTAADYDQEAPYAQKWVGGAPGSGSGVTLYVPTYLLGKVDIEKVYFRGMQTDAIAFTAADKSMMIFRFTYQDSRQRDMSLDPKDEYQNQPPSLDQPPFELLPDQAAISILKNNTSSFIKLTDIQEKEMLPYPSMPPN